MLMVIGMRLLYVGAVERRTAPLLHTLQPNPTASPLSSPTPPSCELMRKEYKYYCDYRER